VPDPRRWFLRVGETWEVKTAVLLGGQRWELFAFAGLWDQWRDSSSKIVETCSILTTSPNAVTSPIHDRMPAILDPDCYDLWLDPGMKDVGAASELLKPYDARRMRCYPVSSRVNHVANDDEECSRPVEPESEAQSRLFL
jgi:putative SOS response-associated peptidase YedK